MHHHHHQQQDHDERRAQAAHGLAQGLGWFSIALGLAELAAPHAIARSLGMRGSERMIQACGMGKIAAGAGILASGNPAPWLWGRVAGDGLDLAGLATGLHHDNRQRRNVQLAMGAVASVALLDIFCAQRMGQQAQMRFLPKVDYSDRSGLPRGVEAARGAAKDFKDRAFSTPEAMRPWKDGKPQNGWSEPGGGKSGAGGGRLGTAVSGSTSVLGEKPAGASTGPIRPGAAGRVQESGGAPLQQAAGSHEKDRDDAFRTGPTFTGSGNEGP